MMDRRPLLVVPATASLLRAFDDDYEWIRVSERAQQHGIVVIAPRETQPSTLMASSQLWPPVLRELGVARVAVVLSVQSYAIAEPVLLRCVRCLKAHDVASAFFHEGHLEGDQIAAWFERRKARRCVTSDAMIRLSERYAERGDARAAYHAVVIAEDLA